MGPTDSHRKRWKNIDFGIRTRLTRRQEPQRIADLALMRRDADRLGHHLHVDQEPEAPEGVRTHLLRWASMIAN